MPNNVRTNRVDFIEFPATSADNVVSAKTFYQAVFGWTYKDWGGDYADTQSSGVGTGINADPSHRPRYPLVVIYSDDLEAARASILRAQGTVTKEIFSFPGGRRFHFFDPAGNELAVWSDR